MFTPQILKFEKKLAAMEGQIAELKGILGNVVLSLKEITGAIRHSADYQKKSWDMFGACSKGFQQVREACECLREELSSAAGTMIDRSWEEACGAGISGGC